MRIIGQMKGLIIMNVLASKMLQRPNLSFEELDEVSREVEDYTKRVMELFDELENAVELPR
jgi:hypothetical protein